tara:strand:+ start:21814 stop:22548 length:735 start_codon:yes stop_codon:yes gene_type:complete
MLSRCRIIPATKKLMKPLLLSSITLLISLAYASGARPTPVPITELETTPGSADEFAVQILTLAYNKQYEEIQPYLSRTWIDFPSNREPEKSWRTVNTATDIAQINLLPVQKSPVHNEVYYARYYVLTEEGRRRGAEFMFMNDDGYKLAVQSNRTSVGNDYIKLGIKKNYALEQLEEQGAEVQWQSDDSLIAVLPNGYQFHLTFDPGTTTLSGLQMLSEESTTELYLVIFDLEGTPTIKLKPISE